jgi:poly-beta-1,6-N-acetyl-D-glucosamine biosynthesis protein PgaD
MVWRDWILSVAIWVLYLFLIREVFIDVYLIVDEGYGWALHDAPHSDVSRVFRFFCTLGSYGAVVVMNGVILIGWAAYNQFRFRGADHRKAIGSVSAAQLGQFYGFSGEAVAAWQQARSLAMIHDEGGKLLAVRLEPIDGGRHDSAPHAVSAP